MGSFAIGRAVNPKAAGVKNVVRLNEDDDIWASVLGPKAKEAFDKQVASAAAEISVKTDEPIPTHAPIPEVVAPTPAPAPVYVAPPVTAAPYVPPAPTNPPLAPAPVIPSTTMGKAEEMSSLADQFTKEAQNMDHSSADYKSMMNMANMVKNWASNPTATAKPQAAAAAPAVAVAVAGSVVPTPAAWKSPLAPQEHMNDGNICAADEETPKNNGGGVCYKKCALLTGGVYPIRTSAYSCCKSNPCKLFGNEMTHIGLCSGFDIAGENEGGRCPTVPGACLQDEEILNGMCFKKCSLFSENMGIYNHRVAPTICCKTKGFGCMLPSNFKTNFKFDAGGGAGDGNAGTPSSPHMPMTALTESSS